MKTHFIIILLVLVGVLSFIIGYSVAPTDVSVVRHSVAQPAASGGSSSGGYGSAPASGGYGAAPAAGGYGAAPAAGGYGAAPASGGYGAQ